MSESTFRKEGDENEGHSHHQFTAFGLSFVRLR